MLSRTAAVLPMQNVTDAKPLSCSQQAPSCMDGPRFVISEGMPLLVCSLSTASLLIKGLLPSRKWSSLLSFWAKAAGRVPWDRGSICWRSTLMKPCFCNNITYWSTCNIHTSGDLCLTAHLLPAPSRRPSYKGSILENKARQFQTWLCGYVIDCIREIFGASPF